MNIFPQATYSNWGEMSFQISQDESYSAYKEIEAILQSYIEAKSEFDPDGKLDNLMEVFNAYSIEFNVLIPTMNYSVSFDCSIGTCMTLSKEIIMSENLFFIPRTFDIQDVYGNLAFYNVRGTLDEDNSQHYSYLRKDILDQFLQKNGLSMVWIIWGEKDNAGCPTLFEKYSHLVKYTPNYQNG